MSAVNQKYIIKNLAPWMMDELLAFSMKSDFDLVLLRKQKPFYEKHFAELEDNGVRIFVEPRSSSDLFKKTLVSLSFLIGNLFKFRPGYNFIVGFKSLRWFMSMDLSLFSEDSNIHSQFATQAPIVAILIKRFYGNKPKVSFTFHAYDIYFKNLWFPFLVRESIGAFSISDYNVKYVKEHFGTEEKILLSRLGVFRRELNERTAAKPKTKGVFTLGLLSWFTEKKGIIYLLEALEILGKDGEVKVRLLLAGDGPMRESLKAYVEDNNLEEAVEFVGIVNKNEKPDFFNQIDAFAMPSIKLKNDQDGIPVVIMEALDYGLPIISTQVSGIPEICKDEFNGKLLPQRDSQALARAIADMASDPESCEKYGKNSLVLSEEYDIVKNSNRKMQAIGWK